MEVDEGSDEARSALGVGGPLSISDPLAVIASRSSTGELDMAKASMRWIKSHRGDLISWIRSLEASCQTPQSVKRLQDAKAELAAIDEYLLRRAYLSRRSDAVVAPEGM